MLYKHYYILKSFTQVCVCVCMCKMQILLYLTRDVIENHDHYSVNRYNSIYTILVATALTITRNTSLDAPVVVDGQWEKKRININIYVFLHNE